MNFNKPKPQKLYEQIASIIEQKINDGHILPGEKLDSVEQLAKNFEVGRSAIREALMALQARGIVEIRQGEGTYIRQVTAEDITLNIPNYANFSQQDLQQIFEVRKILEIGVIENAASRITTQQLLFLKNALENMHTHAENAQISSEADLQFHTVIAEAAHNPLLVSMLQSVSQPIARQIQHTRTLLAQSNKDALLHLHEEHLRIYEALEAQDAQAAKQAMSMHLETVQLLLFRN